MRTCGKWKYSSTIFNLDTGWRRVVSQLHAPAAVAGVNSRRCTSCRRLGVPLSRFAPYGEGKDLFPHEESNCE